MSIHIHHISKTFGSFNALKNVDLEVGTGELVALLGPSGSGKTTLLRIIAGLEFADAGAGSIEFHGIDVTNRSAYERKAGFVFQNYALFNHMTVAENIAFGLRVMPRATRPDREDIDKAVTELLRRIALEGYGSRYPSQLSGGQKQRVALARALAVGPQVLLLDEPFGALDAKVRKTLRKWLRQFHNETQVTTLFVTHDQEEAMAISDRVGVMSHGQLEQIDKPIALYNNPATPFVASFVGLANRIPAEITAKGKARVLNQKVDILESAEQFVAGEKVNVIIRPESLELVSESDSDATRGIVALKSFLGPLTKVGIAVEGAPLIHLHISSREVRKLEIGEKIAFKISSDEVMAERA